MADINLNAAEITRLAVWNEVGWLDDEVLLPDPAGAYMTVAEHEGIVNDLLHTLLAVVVEKNNIQTEFNRFKETHGFTEAKQEQMKDAIEKALNARTDAAVAVVERTLPGIIDQVRKSTVDECVEALRNAPEATVMETRQAGRPELCISVADVEYVLNAVRERTVFPQPASDTVSK